MEVALRSAIEDQAFTLWYREALEAVIGASGELYESRSMQEASRSLLLQFSRLLQGRDRDADVHGLTVERRLSDFEVLARIGRFDQAGAAALEPGVRALLHACMLAGRSILGPGHFVGYFARANGRLNLAYLDGLADAEPVDERVLDLLTRHVVNAFDNLELERDLVDAQTELLTTLSTLLAMRSVESGNHVRRVAHLSRLLAQLSGLPEDQCQMLFIVAPMHDIGKFAIPEGILAKPMALDETEWVTMRDHARLGETLFAHSDKPLLRAAAIVAGQHHEWYDGTGYPRGLIGEQIHVFARIVAVVDAFDALSHRRSYKPAWDFDRVEAEMLRGKATHFDPVLVDLLLNAIGEVVAILRRFPEEGDPDWITGPTGGVS